jgi:hypothetical protein
MLVGRDVIEGKYVIESYQKNQLLRQSREGQSTKPATGIGVLVSSGFYERPYTRPMILNAFTLSRMQPIKLRRS